ncbi:MAG: hypothetical protein IPO10_14350 [Flavobacteriales bacterium]|nr:hypothetical protein [Flavobacteriales bacterium]
MGIQWHAWRFRDRVTEGYTATPQGDCLGAFTLCTGDPVSAGFANPGCANDLSNINWGCLSGGERIGSGMHLRPIPAVLGHDHYADSMV